MRETLVGSLDNDAIQVTLRSGVTLRPLSQSMFSVDNLIVGMAIFFYLSKPTLFFYPKYFVLHCVLVIFLMAHTVMQCICMHLCVRVLIGSALFPNEF